uniref:Polygalacturonase n=1 Tax=Nelumbo nucifera TaxID=4432 RepID=A0A822Z071_NELNU|nr:TPA_asm: hypothetical protein HUJ06_008801 [Nelumbo nucifera]
MKSKVLHITQMIFSDSSDNVCIEDCNISVGYDAIVLKSGWDEYGIAYGKPTKDVHIRKVHLRAYRGSGLAFGSEMSGGISNIVVEHLNLQNSFTGIGLRTVTGRGGYIKDVFMSDLEMRDIYIAIWATGQWGSHPDDNFDPNALPVVYGITLKDITGTNITIAGEFSGIQESPFTSICLSNISLSITSHAYSPWICSSVSGFSDSVSPEPCSDLQSSHSNSSLACFSLLYFTGQARAGAL